MKEEIVIIGAGEIGRAIEKVLSVKDLDVQIWDKDESKVAGQKPLEKIIPEADIIFLCVPSWAMRSVLSSIHQFINKKTVFVSLVKGIEEETFKIIPELLGEFLPAGKITLLAGPMLAEELMKDEGGFGVIASMDSASCVKVSDIFQGTQLQTQCSSDVYGVATASVLKNIYAIALGIAEALGFGQDQKALLITQAIKEMGEIVKIFKGEEKTIYGPAGLGDLIATGLSPYSKNHQAGFNLANKGYVELKGEGIMSLISIKKKLGNQAEKFPLFFALSEIILKKKNAKEVFKDFLK